MEADDTALLPRLLRFHGIPEEGPEDLMLQEVVIDPGAMWNFLLLIKKWRTMPRRQLLLLARWSR
jgi:hypothetical protein